jgi:hypothetical protein
MFNLRQQSEGLNELLGQLLEKEGASSDCRRTRWAI